MFSLTGIYLQLAKVGALIVFVFTAYTWIGYHEVSKYIQKQAIAQAEADRKQQEKYNLIAQELEELKLKRAENARTITKVVEKIIDRPIYRNVCLDSSGLHTINEALQGRSASESHATVQATN